MGKLASVALRALAALKSEARFHVEHVAVLPLTAMSFGVEGALDLLLLIGAQRRRSRPTATLAATPVLGAFSARLSSGLSRPLFVHVMREGTIGATRTGAFRHPCPACAPAGARSRAPGGQSLARALSSNGAAHGLPRLISALHLDVLAHRRHQELVAAILMAYVQALVVRELVAQRRAALQLNAKQRLEDGVIRHLLHGREDAVPIVDERSQVVVSQPHSQQVLEFHDRPFGLADAIVLVDDEQDLTTLHVLHVQGHLFLLHVHLPQQLAGEHLAQSRSELRIKRSKLT